MATHVTKEPVTLDGYQAILKPSEYGHTLTALLPKEIVDALEDERVGGLEWAKSKAKNPRRVTTKPEPWEEVSEGMYQCKFRWKEGDKVVPVIVDTEALPSLMLTFRCIAVLRSNSPSSKSRIAFLLVTSVPLSNSKPSRS